MAYPLINGAPINGTDSTASWSVGNIVETGTAASALRATAADLAEMEAALIDMAGQYEDKQRFNLADIRFHKALNASAHNYVIKQLGEAIGALQQVVFDATYLQDDAVKEITIKQHRELFDAVRMKNPRVAKKISASMIEGVVERLADKRQGEK